MRRFISGLRRRWEERFEGPAVPLRGSGRFSVIWSVVVRYEGGDLIRC